MSYRFDRHTTSFIVRLWVEPTQQEGPPRWRGQIEHVESGERTHFQVPEALLAFVASHLTLPAGPESAEHHEQSPPGIPVSQHNREATTGD